MMTIKQVLFNVDRALINLIKIKGYYLILRDFLCASSS